MLRINGEITTFIDETDFETKEEFMDKMRKARKEPSLKSNAEYHIYHDIIGVAIQQAYYINEKQLLRYKKYCQNRKETGGNKNA